MTNRPCFKIYPLGCYVCINKSVHSQHFIFYHFIIFYSFILKGAFIGFVDYKRLNQVLLLFAILLLAIYFYLSQLIVARKYTSISVTIHFDNSVRFINVDVEATYSHTNESTVLAFEYTEPNFDIEPRYEIFTINLNGNSIYYWSSIPLHIQSGGYVQHVFFDVKFGTYEVSVATQHIEMGKRRGALSILDEQTLEVTI